MLDEKIAKLIDLLKQEDELENKILNLITDISVEYKVEELADLLVIEESTGPDCERIHAVAEIIATLEDPSDDQNAECILLWRLVFILEREDIDSITRGAVSLAIHYRLEFYQDEKSERGLLDQIEKLGETEKDPIVAARLHEIFDDYSLLEIEEE